MIRFRLNHLAMVMSKGREKCYTPINNRMWQIEIFFARQYCIIEIYSMTGSIREIIQQKTKQIVFYFRSSFQ